MRGTIGVGLFGETDVDPDVDPDVDSKPTERTRWRRTPVSEYARCEASGHVPAGVSVGAATSLRASKRVREPREARRPHFPEFNSAGW